MQEWLAALARQDDDDAEQLCAQLTAADEPMLVTLTRSAGDNERWWSVRALAMVGEPTCIPALAAWLQDREPSVRAAAALALAHLHNRFAADGTMHLDAVAQLLADDEGYVRQAAADSLALCGDDSVPALGSVLRSSTHQGARTAQPVRCVKSPA